MKWVDIRRAQYKLEKYESYHLNILQTNCDCHVHGWSISLLEVSKCDCPPMAWWQLSELCLHRCHCPVPSLHEEEEKDAHSPESCQIIQGCNYPLHEHISISHTAQHSASPAHFPRPGPDTDASTLNPSQARRKYWKSKHKMIEIVENYWIWA